MMHDAAWLLQQPNKAVLRPRLQRIERQTGFRSNFLRWSVVYAPRESRGSPAFVARGAKAVARPQRHCPGCCARSIPEGAAVTFSIRCSGSRESGNFCLLQHVLCVRSAEGAAAQLPTSCVNSEMPPHRQASGATRNGRKPRRHSFRFWKCNRGEVRLCSRASRARTRSKADPRPRYRAASGQDQSPPGPHTLQQYGVKLHESGALCCTMSWGALRLLRSLDLARQSPLAGGAAAEGVGVGSGTSRCALCPACRATDHLPLPPPFALCRLAPSECHCSEMLRAGPQHGWP